MNISDLKLNEPNSQKLNRIKNPKLLEFISNYIELCNPEKIFICTDDDSDVNYIKQKALELGEVQKLPIKGHLIHFDGIEDQARDRKNTKILTTSEMNIDPKIATLERETGINELKELMKDSMNGREMIICFFTLGPKNSDFTIPCVQITDSYYVAQSEFLLYRKGYGEFVKNGEEKDFFKFVHAQGELDERNNSKNIDKRRVYIDLKDETVFSVNTQYAGNTVGLKKLAMRIAIYKGSKEGWLTEHMFIMGIHGPKKRVTYITGAFPSMCGKTATTMMPGESVIGDDIAYLRKVSGEIRAVNVEKGSFGVIGGTNQKEDPVLWKAFHNPGEIIFSNALIKDDGNIYWKGKDPEVPKHGKNFSGEWWPGKKDKNGKEIPAVHPNARFTMELEILDNFDSKMDDPKGVKIQAIVYGGREYNTSVPVAETLDWMNGIVTKGASLESETTAATLGAQNIEFNPMANGDFLTIPISQYIQNNLDFATGLTKPPPIFGVNYYLKGEDGNFLNDIVDKRVWYKWIDLRVHREVDAIETPTGKIPKYKDLHKLFREFLNKEYTKEDYEKQFTIRVPENLKKIERITNIYKNISNTPIILFKILEEQKNKLLEIQSKFGDYVTPENLTKFKL